MPKNKKIIILSFIFILLLTSAFGCKGGPPPEAVKPVTLNYWRVWDGPDAFEDMFAAYKTLHPNVTINYRKFRYDEYEQELLEALAEDRGPDILSIHNTWVKKYQSKLAPLPDTTAMVYTVAKGAIKKEIVQELRTTKSITVQELQNNFVDAVYDDAVIAAGGDSGGNASYKIYGLPLAVDTLAMYYNKDLFNNAGIALPPAYWNSEFQEDVKDLTKQDMKGELVQFGAALGGSVNIDRYSDILSVIMMQNGAVMMDDNGNVTFNRIQGQNQNNPGLEALRFYTEFSNPEKAVYSWNKSLDNSLKMFIQGKLAIFFGYAYHLPQIKAQAPKLNFSLAKLPQIEGNDKSTNFANYWLETVSNKSKSINEAWDFIQFAAKADQTKSYLARTGKPAALRALVGKQAEENQDLNVFADQVLTAKSWYHGADANAMEKIMGEMIDQAVADQDNMASALNLAANKIQQTVRK